MSRENNFLLGQGERLTEKVTVPQGGGKKNPPYDLTTAKKRITQKLATTSSEFSSIPSEACPKDEVVAVVTMHPRYISKSDFPEELLRSVGLRSVGSKSTTIKPEKWGIKKHPETAVTEQVFVAGTKKAFEDWSKEIKNWSDKGPSAQQIATIEDLSAFKPTDKIKQINSTSEEITLEVVLHNAGDGNIIRAFEAYATKLKAKPIADRRRDVRGLTFMPVKAHPSIVEDLAKFSFLRVVRGMPRLRPLTPDIVRSTAAFKVTLPSEPPMNDNLRVAIFDGGVPAGIGLDKWVQPIDPPGIGKPTSSGIIHGVGVTSAFLFGHIKDPILSRPFCHVDHVRVLDDQSGHSDLEILDVLDRIVNHLDKKESKYKFINISLGPNLPISDDEVTSWTALLDERLSKSDVLATVAVGNYGHYDASTGLNRILPPSDGVNVLAVGSCDKSDGNWQRAFYSCVGPGRRPGLVKPDGVAFGGSDSEPFVMLAPSKIPTTRADGGTSFSAPAVLRASVGVESYVGTHLSARAIRGLMIHRAHDNGHSKIDVGWGRFEPDISNLITCENDEAIVIYQGELPVGEHLRAAVPVPSGSIKGPVILSATLVIAPEIDPEHPGAYTRSGLEVFFRPHSDKFRKTKDGKKPKHQKTQPFFSIKKMYGAAEYEFREDGHKWEPCIRNSQSFKGSSFKQPCFDIYYHHREGAISAEDPKPIPYALVISVKAPKETDFYNKIVRAYAQVLVPLKPQVQIQVRT